MSAQPRANEMRYFLMLTHSEKKEAIARLAKSGMGDYMLASATGLSVEEIRRILGERTP